MRASHFLGPGRQQVFPWGTGEGFGSPAVAKHLAGDECPWGREQLVGWRKVWVVPLPLMGSDWMMHLYPLLFSFPQMLTMVLSCQSACPPDGPLPSEPVCVRVPGSPAGQTPGSELTSHRWGQQGPGFHDPVLSAEFRGRQTAAGPCSSSLFPPLDSSGPLAAFSGEPTPGTNPSVPAGAQPAGEAMGRPQRSRARGLACRWRGGWGTDAPGQTGACFVFFLPAAPAHFVLNLYEFSAQSAVSNLESRAARLFALARGPLVGGLVGPLGRPGLQRRACCGMGTKSALELDSREGRRD